MFDIARRALALVLLLLASIATVWAQAYREPPLRLLVGFPPGGSGSPQHLAGVQINQITGVDMQHVPFKGGLAHALNCS